MFNKNFLTQGEKIKELRKVLNVTQKELARDTIARSTLGQIEIGGKLYKGAAKIIVKNAFIIASEKGINLRELDELTVEVLMETDEKQVIRIINNFVEELKIYRHNKDLHFLNSTLSEMEFFSNQHKITNLEKLYEITTTLIEQLLLYEDSYVYVLMGIELSSEKSNYQKLVEFYAQLIKIKFRMCEYKSIISDAKHALSLARIHNVQSIAISKIIYNFAMTHNNLGNYNSCLKLLEDLKSNYELEPARLIDINSTIADCMFKLKEYVKAEKLLLKNYNEATNGTNAQLTVSLLNLAFFYIDREKKDIALNYTDILENLDTSSQDSAQLTKNLYYLTLVEIKLNREIFVKGLYKRCLNYACETKNGLIQYELLSKVAEYYISNDNTLELEKLAELINTKTLDKMNSICNPKISEILNDISNYFDGKNDNLRKKFSNYSYSIRRNFRY